MALGRDPSLSHSTIMAEAKIARKESKQFDYDETLVSFDLEFDKISATFPVSVCIQPFQFTYRFSTTIFERFIEKKVVVLVDVWPIHERSERFCQNSSRHNWSFSVRSRTKNFTETTTKEIDTR